MCRRPLEVDERVFHCHVIDGNVPARSGSTRLPRAKALHVRRAPGALRHAGMPADATHDVAVGFATLCLKIIRNKILNGFVDRSVELGFGIYRAEDEELVPPVRPQHLVIHQVGLQIRQDGVVDACFGVLLLGILPLQSLRLQMVPAISDFASKLFVANAHTSSDERTKRTAGPGEAN